MKSVTLNPVLVARFEAVHKERGETAFSRMLEEAMRFWLQHHETPKKPQKPR